MLVTCPSPAGWRSKAACATTKNCFGGLEALLQSTQIEKKEYDEHEMARHTLLPARGFAPDNCGSWSWPFCLAVALGNSDRWGFCSHHAFRSAHCARSTCSVRAGFAYCHGGLPLVGSRTLLPKIPRARDAR